MQSPTSVSTASGDLSGQSAVARIKNVYGEIESPTAPQLKLAK
jgi:hypothetical protein